MGQEDATPGPVSRLVEPLDGKRLPRLVQSSHHLRAQALANTHRLYFSKLNGEASTTSCNSTRSISPPA
jgi:hypothetical protein